MARPNTAPDGGRSSPVSRVSTPGSLGGSRADRRASQSSTVHAKKKDPFARRIRRTGMSNPGPGAYETGGKHLNVDRVRAPISSFGKAVRFDHDNRLYPGKDLSKSASSFGRHSPGPIYEIRGKTKKMPAYRFSGGTFPAQANRPSAKNPNSPGPIYYPTLDFASGFRKQPAYSMNSGHGNMFDREPGRASPGPAYKYECNAYKPRAPVFTARKRLDKASDTKGDLPGPADYGYCSSMDDVSMNSERAPAYTCGERLGPLANDKDKIKVPRDPGPGPDYVTHGAFGDKGITFLKDERFWDESQQSI